jgi:hypothetical protein
LFTETEIDNEQLVPIKVCQARNADEDIAMPDEKSAIHAKVMFDCLCN